MALNLHNVVRQAVQAINADISAAYLKSTGYTLNADGAQVPTYTVSLPVAIQVQPPSSRDLRQVQYLNLQGVIRTVYLYGDPQGIDRVNVQGGDMLMFPQWAGAPVDFWLITLVDESWNVDDNGWSKLIVTLQTDRNFTLTNSEGGPVLDNQGHLIRTT